MRKTKYLLMILFAIVLLLFIPNISNAAVEVEKNVYANNGSAKFIFTGLELDEEHEYEFGVTKTTGAEVSTWHTITEYDATSATIDFSANTREFRNTILAVEKAYITIHDKTNENTVIIDHQPIDLSIPYLNITNYAVLNNGKEFEVGQNTSIQFNFWNANNSTPYYQYEKITDENVIAKYKELKANNGDYNELQSLLKTTYPTTGWTEWDYWNGHTDNGYGYPQKPIEAPDYGLYYMWIYLAGDDVRNLYGYILVDNLQPEIALDSVSLPATADVELGKTLTLTPRFSPENTTNKIVTWSSSDESVATVDNAGKITPKKIGSTIITVTSQDGNKKATCTVTVKAASSEDPGTSGNTPSGNTGNTGNSGNNNNSEKDPSTVGGRLPQTGIGLGLMFALAGTIVIGVISYKKAKDYIV